MPVINANLWNRAYGPALILMELAFQEVGASLAVTVFPSAGPVGMVALRMCFSAAVLWIIIHPNLRGRSAKDWGTAAAYGLALAAMNSCFYMALERLPLGATVTLEMLGPLTLSVVLGRRWVNALWAIIALGGVLLLAGDVHVPADPLGIGFALIAACLWAGCILLTRTAGRRFQGLDGLTLGMTIGGLGMLPLAAFNTGAVLLNPHILITGFAIAILSSAIPYAVEMIVLRRLAPEIFSVLLSLAPAVAALTGWIMLGQRLTLLACAGIALVIVAAMGATIVGTARTHHSPTMYVKHQA
jgi:inner membrane transporter RhtA